MQLVAMINALPASLQNLDNETLSLLLQDLNNVEAILNPDGSINASRIDLLRRGQLNLHAPAGNYSMVNELLCTKLRYV
jgi:hypothetical protein